MPSVKIPTLEEVWQSVKAKPWIGDCPPEDGRHAWVYQAAKGCAAHWLPIRPEQAEEFIRRDLTRPEQHPGEIRHSVANAYKRDYQDHDHEDRAEVKPYDPAKLAEWEKRLPFTLTSDMLKSWSKVSVSTLTPGLYINYVHPGRKVVVINDYLAKGGYIYQDHPAEDAEMIAFANGNRPDQNGKAGAWFCANAVNGEWEEIGQDKYGKPILSIRSEPNLVTYDMAVLESDQEPTPEVPNVARAWCAMLIQQPDLAIVSLVHTGNESVHALIKIPANNKREFNKIKRELIAKYNPLGLDPAAVRPVQQTRLPGIRRSDNGRLQELYYLNPQPIARAIYQNKTASE